MDEEEPDLELEIPNGVQIKKNFVGKHLANYDSMLVLSHFKGHAMGGFGGALKQLSIWCASAYGKEYIHKVGNLNQDVYNSKDEGKEKLIQRIENKKAIYIIETAEKLGVGSKEYELINID